MKMRLYLDHNATTTLRSEARTAMVAALDQCGAPSSIHGDGRAGRKLVDAARRQAAGLVGALPKNVIFTASATEANNMALNLDWRRDGKPALRRIAVSAIEHASVLNGVHANGPVDSLAVGPSGVVDLEHLKALLNGWQREGAVGLISVMLANNETGVIQPLAEISAIVHEAGGMVHCDAAQAAGKMPFAIKDIGADLLTISSHKLGGPLGAGALILATDDLYQPAPLVRGGGQEKGMRAGTENVPALAGFGAAAEAAAQSFDVFGGHVLALRTELERRLRALSPRLAIFGEGERRLPNTLNFADPGLLAETALIALDLEGISLSSGSACSSGKVKVSHVLMAMGVAPELANCALRVSLGREDTLQDIEYFIATWKRLRENLHDKKQGRAA